MNYLEKMDPKARWPDHVSNLECARDRAADDRHDYMLALDERKAAIVAARKAGMSLQQIADHVGINRQRVHVIVGSSDDRDTD